MKKWWGLLLGLCMMPAFALQNELAIYAGEPQPIPARIMLLIDTSLSMSRDLNGCRNCRPNKLDLLKTTLQQFVDASDLETNDSIRWPDSFEIGLARFTDLGLTDERGSAVIEADIRRLDYVYTNVTPNITHRQLLADIISNLNADGWTPLVTSYLETVEYLTGGSAVNGLSACTDDEQRNGRCNTGSVWENGVVGDYRQGMDTSLICGMSNNHLVVLTDGRSTNESAFNLVYGSSTLTIGQRINRIVSDNATSTAYLTGCGTEDTDSTNGTEVDDNFSWDCVNPLAEKLANVDSENSNAVRGIRTHTIAYGLGAGVCTQPFAIPETAPQFLCNWALKGGGSSYAAEDEEGLAAAFQGISRAASLQSTFTAAVPGVGVNQSNRFTYLDDVYYSVFKPNDRSFWYGNLKKYKLEILNNAPAIVGQNSNPVDEDADGFFDADVRSFWLPDASTADGDNVLLGGAAAQISAVASRRLFTTIDGVTTQVTDDSVDEVIDEMIGDDAGTLAQDVKDDLADDYYGPVVEWLRGTDAVGRNEWQRLTGAASAKTLRQLYGAPIHSSPVVVNYTSTTEIDGVDVPITNPALQSNLVFVSTNDAKLYAVDAETGNEKLAFMPGEFLQPATAGAPPHVANLYDAARDDLPGPVLYGLDATWTAWRQDVDRDGNITSDTGDWVYLYGGMRRGGRNYYGLDVTSANDSTPSMSQLFVLQGGVANSPFENMGQTWSEPVLGLIRYNGDNVVVIVVAGGYDPAYDAGRPAGVPQGAQLYIVAAHNRGGANGISAGDVLWWASAEGIATGNHQQIAALTDSIPSTVKVLDKDGDGYLDHIYVGDLGGQIHRIDINKANTGYNTLATSAVVAQLGTRGNATATAADDRRFYFPPSVALMKDSLGRKHVALAIGSGLLTSPRDTAVDEKFYYIRDYAPFGYSIAAADNPSYEYSLGLESEKLLGSPLIVGGQVFFSTYYWGDNAVVANSNQCSAQYGRAALYSYNPAAGSIQREPGVFPQSLAGSIATIMKGIDGIENEDGDLIKPPGSDFIGIGGTAAFDLPDIDLGNIRKTRWVQCPEGVACD